MTSEGAASIHCSRIFGSNSNFLLNSMGEDKSITNTVHKPMLLNDNIRNNTSGDPENPQFFEENRRGVRLSRASKLNELGLEKACSMQITGGELTFESKFISYIPYFYFFIDMVCDDLVIRNTETI